MPRLLNVVVLAVGVAAAALILEWSASPDAATGPGKIRLTSREVSRARIDHGRPGRGLGDTEIIRHNLFNRRVKPTPIGTAEYLCTYTGRRTRSCSVTVFMPKGRLIAGGSIRYRELYELAILGGTRLYDDARGTLTVIRTTSKPPRHIMLFRLTG